MKMDCLFCNIIKGEVPSRTLYEDEIVKVIMDAYPNANGHTLILPKKHFTDFTEMDNETLSHINDIAKMMKERLYNTLNPDGLVLIVNYGKPQMIKHYHLHLIPTYHDQDNTIKDLDETYNKIMAQK